ncbi:hypothetical protein [Phormidium tenue]|uniref:Uncharacterized protein n=1 Tax=Phormidium tenue NIES-30 TaxID=549789 RepID=A0A1U7IYE8_9CYAN|nr:hypothetical protein [Phormidium tenue]MBD2232769.1 hypothetical protein [Phormidium tenue FACHB-1052]OKH43705.1 hypothetical protein NIES30_24445 [Phormidium tenue NIES-30]
MQNHPPIGSGQDFNPAACYSARIITPDPATGAEPADSGQVHLELTLKLHSYPNPDREPVKILVIGSKRSVSSIVVALHQLGFAEIFEWTDFLSAPNADKPFQFQPGEVMKALVKFLPREE